MEDQIKIQTAQVVAIVISIVLMAFNAVLSLLSLLLNTAFCKPMVLNIIFGVTIAAVFVGILLHIKIRPWKGYIYLNSGIAVILIISLLCWFFMGPFSDNPAALEALKNCG